MGRMDLQKQLTFGVFRSTAGKRQSLDMGKRREIRRLRGKRAGGYREENKSGWVTRGVSLVVLLTFVQLLYSLGQRIF